MKEIGIAKNFIPLIRSRSRKLQMGGYTSTRRVDYEYGSNDGGEFDRPFGAIVDQIGGPSSDTSSGSSSPSPDLGIIGRSLSTFVPYASNVASMLRKLPNTPKPILESGITADMIDYSGDVANLEREVRGANLGSSRIGNPGLSRALRASNFGRFLSERSRLAQAERNTNADIINRTRAFNQAVNARNTERLNQTNRDNVERTITQQNLDFENLADFSNKVQLSRRDKQMMDLENRKYDFLERAYNDTGIIGRNLKDLIASEKYTETSTGRRNRRFGGKIYY